MTAVFEAEAVYNYWQNAKKMSPRQKYEFK